MVSSYLSRIVLGSVLQLGLGVANQDDQHRGTVPPIKTTQQNGGPGGLPFGPKKKTYNSGGTIGLETC